MDFIRKKFYDALVVTRTEEQIKESTYYNLYQHAVDNYTKYFDKSISKKVFRLPSITSCTIMLNFVNKNQEEITIDTIAQCLRESKYISYYSPEWFNWRNVNPLTVALTTFDFGTVDMIATDFVEELIGSQLPNLEGKARINLASMIWSNPNRGFVQRLFNRRLLAISKMVDNNDIKGLIQPLASFCPCPPSIEALIYAYLFEEFCPYAELTTLEDEEDALFFISLIQSYSYHYKFSPFQYPKVIYNYPGFDKLKVFMEDLDNAQLQFRAIGGVYSPGVLTTYNSRMIYIFSNLHDYKIVMERTSAPPPPTKYYIQSDIFKMADVELLGYAYVPFEWGKRQNLVYYVDENIKAPEDRWILPVHKVQINTPENREKGVDRVNSVCKNDLTYVDVVTMEGLNDDSPMFLYGNYITGFNCINAETLFGYFVIDSETGYPSFHDPFASSDKVRDLSLNQVVNILKMCQNYLRIRQNPVIKQMVTSINQGLESFRNANKVVDDLREKYKAYSDAEKRIMLQFMLWIFKAGMYGRYWKGPGQPYPFMYKEGGALDVPGYCMPAQRDENIYNAMIDLEEFLDVLKTQHPKVYNDIKSIPRIWYNFKTKEAKVGLEKVIDLINLLKGSEKLCLTEFGDKMSGQGYYMLRKILNLDEAQLNKQVLKKAFKTNQDFEADKMVLSGHLDVGARMITI